MATKHELLPPIHPGEILMEEFMKPLGLSINQLARDIHVPSNRVSAIVNCKRAISADTALRLARYFANTPQFWLNLQLAYDLEVAERNLNRTIERQVQPRRAA